MMQIDSKLPNMGTTIFTVMSQLAAEHKAINLSQGFPNFPIAEGLQNTIARVVQENTHQYVPLGGYPKLLDAVQNKIKRHYNRDINASEELLITAGATQAIFTAIQALIQPGDEVIILDPSYDCYAPAVKLAGGKAIHVNLNEDFNVDWNKVAYAFSSKTKMIITNNPHNPSGQVFELKDIEALELILEKFPKVFLLSDEVYEFIHFEKPHISAHTREKLKNRSIITSSFGKTFHVTGWKIGYVVAPKEIMVEIKKVHQYLVFCVNSICQIALAEYLPKTDLHELSVFYKKKRDFFTAKMTNSKFELLPSYGSYFQTARYTEISDKSDVEFAKWLTVEKGVAVIPTSVFNANGADNKIIRFCFAKTEETIVEATNLLCKI
ncbi:MAG: methionine aminotransferase [Lishizhenia sp.]